MRSFHRGLMAGTLAVGLLAPLLWLHDLSAGSRPSPVRGVRPPPPRTVSQKALREALGCWYKAQDAVHTQLDALEAWDPAALEGVALRQMHRDLLVTDAKGWLRQAHLAASQAEAAAETPDERRRTAGLLARIEHDLGNHETELLHAQTMAAQQPRDWTALAVLRRAAACNGHKSLELRALRGLQAQEWRYYDSRESR